MQKERQTAKNVWKINQDKQCNDKYMYVEKKTANTDASGASMFVNHIL